MDVKYRVSLIKLTIVGLIAAAAGWVGIYFVVFTMVPTLWPRWLLFFSLTLALCGTAMPIIGFLNYRFADDTNIYPHTIMREVLWVGFYGDLLLWMQLGRILNSGLAVFLAFGIIVIEFLWRNIERAQWTAPGIHPDE